MITAVHMTRVFGSEQCPFLCIALISDNTIGQNVFVVILLDFLLPFQENRYCEEHTVEKRGLMSLTVYRILAYEYLSISVPPCEPVVIQYRSPIPIESIQIAVTVILCELSHRTLGQGSQQGFVQVERLTVTNGTFFLLVVGSSVLTFPPK